MRRSRCFSFSLVLLTLAFVQVSSAAQLPDGFRLEPVLGGLTDPSSLAATPDGRILITERTTGDLRVVRYGRLESDPLCSVAVNSTGDAGLLGVAVHPDFKSNGWIYLYYTSVGAGNPNKVTRYTVTGSSCGSAADILSDLGSGPSFLRNGGGIGFGPDGKLYVATGDVEDPSNGQTGSVLEGKVLQLDDDGGNLTTYAVGVRDGRGVAFSPGGTVYVSDQGSDIESAHDELHAVQSGGNLGWDDETGTGGVHDQPLMALLPTVGIQGIAAYAATGPFPDLDSDGKDNDHDKWGDPPHPGVTRFDDDHIGECVGSEANGNPCSTSSECVPLRAGENTHYCELRDNPEEWCPGGVPYDDDDCDAVGAAGVDEPDESFLDAVFMADNHAPAGPPAPWGIRRAVLTGAGLDQISSSEVFLDSAFLPDCPTGWTGVMTGNDGWLYAVATNGGGSAGALYRIVYDGEAGPREVSPKDSHFPLMVGKTQFDNRVALSWEDLRSESMQPRNSGALAEQPVREYTVWVGTMGDYASHSPATGLDATAGITVNDAVRTAQVSIVPTDNDYFLVSGRGHNLEGTTGSASSGAERAGYAVTELCDTIGYHFPGFALWACGNDFTLVTEHGEIESLYDEYRGKVVLLDFSAIWCPPCVTEANVLEALYQDYRDRGVEVLTILMDEDSQSLNFNGRPTAAEARNWVDRPGANPDHSFECWIDPNPPASKQAWPVYNQFGALPTNVILDTGLRVAYSGAGYSEGTIRNRLNNLVGSADACLD